MKNLIILVLLFAAFSCAPTAEFVRYDVYKYQPFIYNEDGVKDLPPDLLEDGESWVWRVGIVERTYRPKEDSIINQQSSLLARMDMNILMRL